MYEELFQNDVQIEMQFSILCPPFHHLKLYSHRIQSALYQC